MPGRHQFLLARSGFLGNAKKVLSYKCCNAAGIRQRCPSKPSYSIWRCAIVRFGCFDATPSWRATLSSAPRWMLMVHRSTPRLFPKCAVPPTAYSLQNACFAVCYHPLFTQLVMASGLTQHGESSIYAESNCCPGSRILMHHNFSTKQQITKLRCCALLCQYIYLWCSTALGQLLQCSKSA